MLKCPYCNYTTNKSWKSIAVHINTCTNNNNEYFISITYGPIHYTKYLNLSLPEFKNIYPSIDHRQGLQKFKKKGIISKDFIFCIKLWTDEEIIQAIQDFVEVNGKIPETRDFECTNNKYPSNHAVKSHFGSWNNAIKAAGFEPNMPSNFSKATKGLDGHTYRSKAEAYFADNYLWNKYEYIIEPKYPNSTWMYDWYIPSLDLYIELDGGIRPERTKEKIELNKLLSRNCKFIKIKDIYKKNTTGPLVNL